MNYKAKTLNSKMVILGVIAGFYGKSISVSCVSVVANLMGLFLNYRYITFATAMEAGWRLSVHVGPDFSKELWCVIMNT